MVSASDTEFDVKRLVGKSVKIMPYARGWVPRDTLYRLWFVLEAQGLTEFVFHSHFENGTPYLVTGDLVEFVKMFDDPNRFLLIVMDNEGDKIAGAIWFDDVVQKHKGSISIFMCKGYRGDTAIEAVRMALDYAFNALGMKSIWAITPWSHAAKLALKTGFKAIVTVPEMLPSDDGDKDLHILRIKREEF